MRILLDTNVYISALLFGGNPRAIVQSVIKKEHTAITSPVLLSELADVLRKKFGYSHQAVIAVDRQIRKQCTVVLPKETIDVLSDVPDNRVLEAANEGNCAVIITGDSDLLLLKQYRAVRILTPSAFISYNEQRNT